MIYSQLSKITRSSEFPLADGVNLVAEGSALVGAHTAGVFGLDLSSAAAGNFMGFALMQTSAVPAVQTTATKVEQLTTTATGVDDADGLVTLSRTPVGKVLARIDSTGAAVSDANTTESGDEVTLTDVGGGVSVTVTYRYTLTALESRSLYGDPKPEGFSGNIWRQVGVAQEGLVYTDQFDVAVDWATASTINLGASGILTTGGSGSAINGVVVALPSVGYPYLGIQFSAV